MLNNEAVWAFYRAPTPEKFANNCIVFSADDSIVIMSLHKKNKANLIETLSGLAMVFIVLLKQLTTSNYRLPMDHRDSQLGVAKAMQMNILQP